MKYSKTLIAAALIAGSLFTGSLAASAQDSTNAAPAAGSKAMRPRGLQAENLAAQLELTADQKPKFKAALDEMIQKMRALRTDDTIAQADKRAKSKEIRDATNAKLKEILTPEQYAKWQKIGPGSRRRPAPAAPADVTPAPATPQQ